MTGRTASPTPLGGGITSVESGILESFPDQVVVVSRARVVVAANRAAREIVGLGYHGRDLALSLRHPEVLDAVDRVRDSGQPATVEVSFPGAVPRDFNLQVAAIPSGETSPGADIVLVFHDITTAKRSENMRADFVANVSHELRSPLSALLGFIETMRGPARDDGAARERFLDIMQNEARRMTRLIDDLLSLSRVEMNEHVAPTGEVDLASVLRVVVDTAAASSAEARSRLRIDVPGGLPKVVGHTDELRQVFQNLVDNALKYARPGTPVRIGVTEVARIPNQGRRGVAVAVVDQGEGIPAADVPRLTERFYRVDKGRSRSVGGTGLGLAIVKHIVSHHRGHLAIESTPGFGSTFTVTLPSVERDARRP
jgi:two-component system phosphate regulon sensor histidine kinase PhoR